LSVCRVLLVQQKPKLGCTKPSTGSWVGHNWSKSSCSHVSLQVHSSSANCVRELFKPSKDSASLSVCSEKKFWICVPDFLECLPRKVCQLCVLYAIPGPSHSFRWPESRNYAGYHSNIEYAQSVHLGTISASLVNTRRQCGLSTRAVKSEVPSSDSDSWQFRLSDSNSDLDRLRPSAVLVT